MLKASVLIIGSEILSGAVRDANTLFIARQLSLFPFQLIGQTAVPDKIHEIRDALDTFLAKSDLVIVTGGLGPTFDDITKKTLASYFGCPLVFNPRQYGR